MPLSRQHSSISRNHSGFSLDDGCAPFRYNVSRGGLNSGVTGFCFGSKLRKCSEDLFFFWSPRRKIGDLCKNLCCSATENSARRSHRTRLRQTGCLELLSEISRTAPGYSCEDRNLVTEGYIIAKKTVNRKLLDRTPAVD